MGTARGSGAPPGTSGEQYEVTMSGEQYEVTNPATGEVLATDTPAGPDDVHEAVAAARAAFAGRSEAMLRWVDHLHSHSEEFAQTESRNAGMPIRLTRGFDVPGTRTWSSRSTPGYGKPPATAVISPRSRPR
ncbi:aldehyde dehydrogenase family protein [Streptomyces sp. NPDC002928]|uniref:aldehyde dehydrogenase family protein n=1 Tax=Streptomyces sp. NPDC002928 TaxID=3154440 RepID=UPI0033A59C26